MKSLFGLVAFVLLTAVSCTSTVSVPVENVGKYEYVDFRKGDEIITITRMDACVADQVIQVLLKKCFE